MEEQIEMLRATEMLLQQAIVKLLTIKQAPLFAMRGVYEDCTALTAVCQSLKKRQEDLIEQFKGTSKFVANCVGEGI